MKIDRDSHSEARELEFERLELALKASNEGIWDWWTDRKEISYSRRILEFLECGDSRAPNVFIAPHDSIHPLDRPRFELALTQALQTGGPETFAADARVQTGSGEWRWLRMRGTVVRDREGHAIRIAGSMIDISLRKAAEAQVEEERYLLRQLIDHVPVQVYFKDLESRFVMANNGMAERMGYQYGSDLNGKHDSDFFESDHWVDAAQDEQDIMRSGQEMTEKLEQETWRKDGAPTWVITSKFPWRDKQGEIKGTFGVSSDVTKLVNAEQAATELANELQHRNAAYEEELQLAREIQQALATTDFPSITSPSGDLAFGSRYIPISGLAGDFYEVIQVNENTVGILICDVMGHGVRSALVVAMLRGLLEKQRSQALDPGLFLKGLNDGLAAILQRAGTTMFATAFYGLINLDQATLKYSCAGHPGPILADENGVHQIATERREKGPGLGLIGGAHYPTNEQSLEGIQRIILFTDGVLEAENQEGEPFFEKRLMEIVKTKSDQTLEQLLDDILTSVLEFSTSQHFDDDVCLLGIEIQRQLAHKAG